MPKTPRWTPPAGLAHDLEARGEHDSPSAEALPDRQRSMTSVGMPSAGPSISDIPEKRDAERLMEKMERLKDTARRVREEESGAAAPAPQPAPVEPETAAEPIQATAPEKPPAATDDRTGRIPAVRTSEPEPGVAVPSTRLAAEERATVAEAAAKPEVSAGLFGEVEDDDDFAEEDDEPKSPRSKSFEDGFLGDMDDDDDDDDDFDGEFEGAVARRRSVPIVPIGIGMVVVAGIGLFMFRGELFGDANKDPSGQVAAADTEGEDGSDEEAPAVEPAPSEPEKAETDAAEPGTDAAPAEAAPTPTPEGTSTPPTEPAPTEAAPEAPPATPPAVASPEGFEEELEKARTAYKRRKLAQAKESVEAALAMSANHPDGLVLKAQIQLEQSDAEGALQTANLCVGVDATKADCWLTIAVLQQSANNIQPAIKAWEQYLAHAPPDARYVSSAKKEIKRLKKKLG